MHSALQAMEPRIRLTTHARQPHGIAIDKQQIILLTGQSRQKQRTNTAGVKD